MRYWCCIEDIVDNKLYCVYSSGKEDGIKKIEEATGFIYQAQADLITTWSSYRQVCSAYGIPVITWEDRWEELLKFNSAYISFDVGVMPMTVFVINHGEEKKEERYGVYCGKCGQYCPHAIYVDSFKCWGCSHGY